MVELMHSTPEMNQPFFNKQIMCCGIMQTIQEFNSVLCQKCWLCYIQESQLHILLRTAINTSFCWLFTFLATDMFSSLPLLFERSKQRMDLLSKCCSPSFCKLGEVLEISFQGIKCGQQFPLHIIIYSILDSSATVHSCSNISFQGLLDDANFVAQIRWFTNLLTNMIK